MMTREPLPFRRYNESSEFVHLGIRYAMQIGVYDDGRVGEMFLQMEKATGSFADTTARDVAILISMAIQHGVPIDRMLSAITKDENGRPEGLAGALLDHLKEWTPKRDGWGRQGDDGGIPIPEHLAPQVHAMLRIDGLITEEAIRDEMARVGPMLNRQNARQFGYTGDQCTSCQSFTMVRNGTCLKCDTCGTTTGCS